MTVANQIAPISPMAHHTVMVEHVGKMRVASREAEAGKTSPYVPVDKPAGSLTPKQQESNEDRLRAKEIVAQNSQRAFSEHFPPPPSSSEMLGFQSLATKVARENYQKHPVKVVPFASQVARAYEQSKKTEGLYVEQVKLPPLYA